MLISGSADPKYRKIEADISYNVPSGILMLNDNTPGGAPLSGIYGIPSDGIFKIPEYQSGIQGDSLHVMMNYFPQHTIVAKDESSVGAQLLNGFAALADSFVYDSIRSELEDFVFLYPAYESSRIYEWDFSSYGYIKTNQAVEGKLGNRWIEIPLADRESTFWQQPITRTVATDCIISGINLLDWANIEHHGTFEISIDQYTPLINPLYITIASGAEFIFGDPEDVAQPEYIGYIEIFGKTINDDLKSNHITRETISITSNRRYSSFNSWQYVDKIVAHQLDNSIYIKADVLNYQPKFRIDQIKRYNDLTRGSAPQRVIWRRGTTNSTFHSITQNEEISRSASDEFWLVKTTILPDLHAQGNEALNPTFNIRELFKIYDTNNMPVSGIIDFVVLPFQNYIAAVDYNQDLWIIDTNTPALDMSKYPITQESPMNIQIEWPVNSYDTLGSFDIKLYSVISDNRELIRNYRWIVHHHNMEFVIDSNGNEIATSGLTTWNSLKTEYNTSVGVDYTISGAGQYTFELDMITDTGSIYRTFSAIQVNKKHALGKIPMMGVVPNQVSGIDIDTFYRLWAIDGHGDAVRMATYHDVASWVPDEQILVTRELYDDVRMQ